MCCALPRQPLSKKQIFRAHFPTQTCHLHAINSAPSSIQHEEVSQNSCQADVDGAKRRLLRQYISICPSLRASALLPSSSSSSSPPPAWTFPDICSTGLKQVPWECPGHHTWLVTGCEDSRKVLPGNVSRGRHCRLTTQPPELLDFEWGGVNFVSFKKKKLKFEFTCLKLIQNWLKSQPKNKSHSSAH